MFVFFILTKKFYPSLFITILEKQFNVFVEIYKKCEIVNHVLHFNTKKYYPALIIDGESAPEITLANVVGVLR